MPRITLAPGGPSDPAKEFDLCRRCADDPAVLEAVIAKRMGVPVAEAPRVPHGTLGHLSYDFSSTPKPCLSCARILSAEDD